MADLHSNTGTKAFGNSLATRLFRAIMGLYIVFAVVSTGLQIYLRLENAEQTILSDIEDSQRTFTPALAEALWAFERSRVSDIISNMNELPAIAAIMIFDETGKILEKTNSPLFDQLETSAITNTNLISHRFDIIYEAPLSQSQINLGQGIIYIDPDEVYRRVFFGASLFIVTTFVEMVLLGALIFFTIRLTLGAPLGNLAREVAKLDETNIGTRKIDVGLKWSDELAVMQDAINGLSQRLQSAFRRIGQLNDELNLSMDARNAQLETTQSELNSSVQRLSAVLDNTFQFIGICASDGTLLQTNKAAFYILGQKPKELMGLTIWEAPSLNTDASLRNKVKNAVLQAGYGYFSRFELTLPDPNEGQIRVYDFIVSPVRSEAGEVALVVCEAHDITNQKRAEEVASRAAVQAETANEAKSHFLATMSHEIRTPMNGIIGMLDILGETSLRDNQQKMVTTVRRSAFTLLDILDDILDFSKIEAGKLDIEDRPISVIKCMSEVSETLASSAAQKGIILREFIDPEIPASVMGDEVRLRQILYNLAGNALKFTGDDANRQGVIDIRAQLLTSTVGGLVEICFSITDTGIGIEQDRLDHLFEPFSQAETSTTRRFGGTGLGLSIVRRLTEAMGGTVTVNSKIGQGTEFMVSIPFQVTPTNAEHSSLHLNGRKVLVTSSDAIFVDRLTQYISAMGGVCKSFESLDGLVEHLESSQVPIACIIDTNESQKSKKLQAAVKKIALPPYAIIFVSDWSDKQAADTGAYGSLRNNPLSRLELEGMLDAIASGKKYEKVSLAPDPTAKRLLKQAALPNEAERVDLLAVPVSEDDQDQPTSAAGHILVAEDNEVNQEVIASQLELLGYSYEMTANGKEALACHEEKSFDLLLTDCHMPEMDGFELTQKIRDAEKKTGAHLTIVAITANAVSGEAERCKSAGMDDYLSKPVELETLKKSLAKNIQKETTKKAV